MQSATPILAFDLHGVVIRLSRTCMFKKWWHFERKWRFVFAVCCHPTLICKGLWLATHHGTDEELYALFDRYTLDYAPLIVELTCCHEPIAESVALLERLKKNGYPLHVLSNIGPRRLARLAADLPSVMSLFDAVHTTTVQSGTIVKKPQERFFATYLARHAPAASRVIFIDNSRTHLRAAEALGITCVRFKNAKRLAADLQKLGIKTA